MILFFILSDHPAMDTGVGQNCDDQDPLDISEESMAATQPNADKEANTQTINKGVQICS